MCDADEQRAGFDPPMNALPITPAEGNSLGTVHSPPWLEVSPENIVTLLNNSARSALRIAILSLALLYIPAMASYWGLIPSDFFAPFSTMAFCAGGFTWLVALLIQLRRFPARAIHPAGAFVAGLVLLDISQRFYLSDSPELSAYLGLLLLLMIAGGCFLSRAWYGTVAIGTLAVWCTFAWMEGFKVPWPIFGTGLLVTSVLGGWNVWSRRSSLIKLTQLRSEAESSQKGLKSAIQTAQQNEIRYRALSECNIEGLVVHDKGKILDANKAVTEMLGYAGDEMVDHNLVDFLSQSSRRNIDEALQFGTVRSVSVEGIRKDGSTLPLELFAKSAQYQDRRVMITALRDVTEQKKLEQEKALERNRLNVQVVRQAALAEIELAIDQPDELHSALQHITEAASHLLPATVGACLLVKDAPEDETFTVCASTVANFKQGDPLPESRAADGACAWIQENLESLVYSSVGPDAFKIQKLFGPYVEAFVGIPIRQDSNAKFILFVLDQEETQYSKENLDFLSTLASRGEVAIARVQVYEQLREANRLLKQQSDELQDTNKALVSANQQTERVNLQLREANRLLEQRTNELETNNSELVRAKNAAESANLAKSEFLNTISHELRTPMNGILGMVDLMICSNLNSQQTEYAQTIRGSAENLLNLINDLLDLSTLQSGKMQLQCQPFMLSELLDNVLATQAIFAESKDLDFISWIPETVPLHFKGDATRITQVLSTLIHNSIKFTSAGEVYIGVELMDRTDQIATLQFQVKDTGVGIPENAQNRLFEAFSQADASPTRAHDGAGLGLSISKNLVELMQGEIGFSSEPNQGSNFWFKVPLEVADQKVPEQDDRDKSLSGKHVLVVDDNTTQCDILARHLKRWSMACDQAQNSKSAMNQIGRAAASGRPYDCVFVDWYLGEENGLDLAHRLCDFPHSPVRKMILLTPFNKRPESSLTHKGKIGEFLDKPIRQNQLRQCLVNLLSP